MDYTQVELSNGELKEVWWLPVPVDKAKVGEIITRSGDDEGSAEESDWTITGVFTTLMEESIPAGSRIATDFKRIAHTEARMFI